MDDLLSAAICEAGLEEFLLAPEITGTEVEKWTENDLSSGSVSITGQINVIEKFSSAEVKTEKQQIVESLSGSCTTLPSCSHTDSESNSRSQTLSIDDSPNKIENAPPAAIQQRLVKINGMAKLPSDMNPNNAKQTVLPQPENKDRLWESGNNVPSLRHPVTVTQQRLQSRAEMVN